MVQWRDNVETLFTDYVTGANPDMQLDVPFFVTSEQLLHLIVGLNLVKVIPDNQTECFHVNMFPSVIVNKNEDHGFC